MASSPFTINADTISLNGIGALSNAIRNSKTPAAIKIAEALETLYQGLGDVSQALATATVEGSITIPPAATVVDFTLVAAMTTTITPVPPTSAGQLLYYFVQSAGSTALLAWGTTVKFGTANFDSTANLWTVFSFVARIDPVDSVLKWFETCLPYTSQS